MHSDVFTEPAKMGHDMAHSCLLTRTNLLARIFLCWKCFWKCWLERERARERERRKRGEGEEERKQKKKEEKRKERDSSSTRGSTSTVTFRRETESRYHIVYIQLSEYLRIRKSSVSNEKLIIQELGKSRSEQKKNIHLHASRKMPFSTRMLLQII